MAFICGIFVANVVAYVKVTNIHRVTKKSRQRVVFSEPKNELSIPKKAGSEMFLSSLGTCVSPTRAWWHVGRVNVVLARISSFWGLVYVIFMWKLVSFKKHRKKPKNLNPTIHSSQIDSSTTW